MAISKVPDDQLDDVAGGYVFKSRTEGAGFYRKSYYQVIDDEDGRVLQDNMSYGDAVETAMLWGLSNRELNGDQLQRLRETGSIT